jgi:hypothetical protein
MNYLSVSVFADTDPRMTQRIAKELLQGNIMLYVEHEHGPTTEADLDNSDRPCVVLTQHSKMNGEYRYFMFEGEDRLSQAQGIFIYASDSRFRDKFGHQPWPLHVHESFSFF